MKGTLTFEEFLALDQGVNVDPKTFLFYLGACALCAYILSQLYVRFGTGASNRSAFASNFVLLAMTTMIIITVVKSSLALSLGLVGALSIVRFRAAIKEPEELVFLFICIALGLGFGAQHIAVTSIGFACTCVAILLRYRGRARRAGQSLFVALAVPDSGESSLQDMVGLLEDHCSEVQLHRFDQSEAQLDATFQVDIRDFAALDKLKRAVQAAMPQSTLSFIDRGDLP